MSEIIASTYEIIKHIGAGGGGNVYLAKHLRLNKNVVLKADKRKISANPTLLRREVDVLKDLSHTYIPKVFDFFVENETVYTVMDYISGESLDKPLKRGERFSQPQVIAWAKQLLEALVYLHAPVHGDHSKGFVHSDIKPANLMKTKNGDICLIDFNIALALGEVNFVGCSQGYASPEHYGLDYSQGFDTALTHADSEAQTVIVGQQSGADGNRTVIPDVRSDIYSTGATLYHLLSGRRPAANALDIEPLTKDCASPQIIEIISKAMSPNPDLRYQTAQEMLDAFEQLHTNDIRVKRLNRGIMAFEACMCVLLAVGAFCTLTGLNRMKTSENMLRLAGASQTALAQGDANKAVELALQAMPNEGIFTPESPAEAEFALAQALNVYQLSDGYYSSFVIELESEPLCMELSPDGGTVACIISGSAQIYAVDTGALIAQYSTDKSALSEIHYIDSRRVVFAGQDGISVCDIYGGNLWTGEKATGIAVSEDGTTIAAVNRSDSTARIYDADTGALLRTVDFGNRQQSVAVNDIFVNPRDNLFELNNDGTLLAVSFSDGSLSVFDREGEFCILDNTSGCTHFEGGFNNQFLALAAHGNSRSLFMAVDCVNNQNTLMADFDEALKCIADSSGIYLEYGGIVVGLSPQTGEQTALGMCGDEVCAFAIDGDKAMLCESGSDNCLNFFDNSALISEISCEDSFSMVALRGNAAVACSENLKSLKILSKKESNGNLLLSYDPSYLHSEARVSRSGNTFMLFSIYGFRIYSDAGEVLCEQIVDDWESVYDQQYVSSNDGEWLEVTYYSGRVMRWSVADGCLIYDEMEEPPDRSLDETLTTASYKAVSLLHGKPQIYDLESGEFIAELDEDAYLTYITELSGKRLVAQFVTTDGYCYGVLMNEKCEKLAELPYLCDVFDDTAVFDYPNGNLRSVRFYNKYELIEKAQERGK